MLILTADQIRYAEKVIESTDGITSLELMDRAIEAMFPHLLRVYEENGGGQAVFFCGGGNNGGDGIGLARLLAKKYPEDVDIVMVAGAKRSPNTQAQLKRLPKRVSVFEVSDSRMTEVAISLGPTKLLVDAFYGSGLNRPLEGLDRALVQTYSNKQFREEVRIVSIDVPSGIPADGQFGPDDNSFIRADVTLSVLSPKLWEFLPEWGGNGGEVIHVPLPRLKERTEYQKIREPDTYREWHRITTSTNQIVDQHWYGWFVEESEIRSIKAYAPPPRTRFGHKGTYGHALLIGGSLGKCGAIQLSGLASLHTGSGLTTLALPDCGTLAAQTSIPEAMCLTGLGQERIERFPDDLKPYTAVGIGPGLGRHPETAEAFHRFLQREDLPPLVLDADALNILSENPTWLDLLPEDTILTPHPKEFDRLANGGEAYATSRERMDAACAFASTHKVVLVLKGGYTFVSSPDGPPAVVGSGAPELATGGTGDVLTGIVTSLRAQKMEAFAAAVSGCYLHGIASQLATGRQGEAPRSFTLTAGDVARNIGVAMHNVFG